MIVNYAVGDIHGQHSQLIDMLNLIERDAAANYGLDDEVVVVFLGDYVDRGPLSKEVVSTIMSYSTFPSIKLKGNHEDMMVYAARSRSFDSIEGWIRNGGRETLRSYDPSFVPAIKSTHATSVALDAIPPDHIEWMETLPFVYETPLAYYVHAAYDPNTPYEQQDEMFCIWSRNRDFMAGSFDVGKPVVHGHTIQRRASRTGNRIGVDTGVYATGVLSTVVIDSSGREDFLEVEGPAA